MTSPFEDVQALGLRRGGSVTIWEVILWGFMVCFVSFGSVIFFSWVYLKCRNYCRRSRERRLRIKYRKKIQKEGALSPETLVEPPANNPSSQRETSSTEHGDKHPKGLTSGGKGVPKTKTALDMPKMDNLNSSEVTDLPKVDNIASGNINAKGTEVLLLTWDNKTSKNFSPGYKEYTDNRSSASDSLKNPLFGRKELYKEMQERMAQFENQKSKQASFIV